MHSRPSEVYGIERAYGSFAAYCFDSAVVAWGTAFESALENSIQGAKNSQAAQRVQGQVLRRWVDVGTAGYADPAQR